MRQRAEEWETYCGQREIAKAQNGAPRGGRIPGAGDPVDRDRRKHRQVDQGRQEQPRGVGRQGAH
eukprot:9224776-Heterocapsa_arctica.AAC.1